MQIFLKGGLEQYFNNLTSISINESILNTKGLCNLKNVFNYLKEEYPLSNNNLFKDCDLAPGNLCIVNDKEYEIKGGIEATVRFNDRIYFISTMHGG